jgi:ketosteroid isomerase-like protein
MPRPMLVVALALALAGCRSTPAVTTSDAVSLGVRKALADQVDAWNRGDLEGFMAGYWRSPSLVFFSGGKSGGSRTEGWDPMIERFRRNYQAGGREMGHLTFEQLQVVELSPDAALARGTWRLDFEKQEPKRIEGLFTVILRRLSDGWRIIHDHTSES